MTGKDSQEEDSYVQDLDLRKKAKQLEFLWRGARSFGDHADVFTGSFPTGKASRVLQDVPLILNCC